MSADAPNDWLGDDELPAGRALRAAQLARVWAGPLAAVALLAGFVLALVAAHELAGSDLGTRLRARTCDASPLWPLLMFAVSGACIALTPRLLALRAPTTIVTWRVSLALCGSLVPAALMVLTLPGTLGCGAARTIARWQLLGDSLTGTAGVALCVASALGLGIMLMHALHVGSVSSADLLEGEQPTIVELAMQEADELDRESELRRFRGVD